MAKNGLPSDDELFIAVKVNDMAIFTTKSNQNFIYQLRFTDSLYNILHLCCYYQRKDMVSNLLDQQCAVQLMNGKDRNGETPLHIACFLTNQDISIRLLNKGASLNKQNIYGKNPIDVIPNYEKRSEFITSLLKKKPNIHVKELDLLKLHKRQCEYLEALAEIIFAQDNRHQFKINRGMVQIHNDNQFEKYNNRNKVDYLTQLKEFKIGLRPFEEFYSPGNKIHQPSQYNSNNKENSLISPNFGATTSQNPSMKTTLKPTITDRSANINNYVSQNHFNFEEVPQNDQNNDQQALEQQFRSIQQSFVDPNAGLGNLNRNQKVFTEHKPTSQIHSNLQSRYHNNYNSRILTPQKNFDDFGDEEEPVQPPDIFSKSPNHKKINQDIAPQFNYIQESQRHQNQIRQSPDKEEEYILDYKTVKESGLSYIEKEPNQFSRYTQQSIQNSVVSYRGIKQERDHSEDLPPHSSSKKQNFGNEHKHLNRNNQIQNSNRFVIHESPEFGDTLADEDSDPYRTVAVQDLDYDRGRNIRQENDEQDSNYKTFVLDDFDDINPYKTHKVQNQSGIQSQYMTMNLDNQPFQSGTSQMMQKNNNFIDKLSRFEKNKHSQLQTEYVPKQVRIDRSSSNKKNIGMRYI